MVKTGQRIRNVIYLDTATPRDPCFDDHRQHEDRYGIHNRVQVHEYLLETPQFQRCTILDQVDQSVAGKGVILPQETYAD